MWKLIVITLIALYVIRKVLRLLTPPDVSTTSAVELKACAYCDILVRVDKGESQRGYFFCCGAHATRFFAEGRDHHV
jgi:hypothetical protein